MEITYTNNGNGWENQNPIQKLSYDNNTSSMTTVEIRDLICEVENKIIGHKDVVLESPPLKHSFAPGIYVREITIPGGMLLTGAIHKHEHPNFLLKGEVTVLTESGGVQRLKAPQSIISPPGTKRLIYTHTETVWTTVHHNPDNIEDIEELEEMLVTNSFVEFHKYMEGLLCHSG